MDKKLSARAQRHVNVHIQREQFRSEWGDVDWGKKMVISIAQHLEDALEVFRKLSPEVQEKHRIATQGEYCDLSGDSTFVENEAALGYYYCGSDLIHF